MKRETSSKKRNLFRTIPLAFILIVSVRYLFDEDPYNDHIGWLLMILFWIYKGLFDVMEDKRNGNKKSMVGNVIFVIAGFGILLWQLSK